MPTRPKIFLFDHSPHLRAEWDYEKNVDIDPEKITHASNRKVAWKCTLMHEWAARVSNRALKNNGCPYCSGRKAISGVNDLGTLYPDIALEWADSRSIREILPQSNYRAQWICIAGHKYSSLVYSRIRGGVQCPVCNNRELLVGYNDIKTRYPELAKELLNSEVAETVKVSKDPLTWVCSQGHTWSASAYTRLKGHGCPKCSGYCVIEGETDLGTLNPILAAELLDKSLASRVSTGSSASVDWMCEKGHVWNTGVYNRTRGTGCPKCSKVHTSRPEQALKTHLGEVYNIDYKYTTYKIDVACRGRKSMTVDILFETSIGPVVVEYDGSYFHYKNEAILRDTEQTNALLLAGYTVIRIREQTNSFKLPKINVIDSNLLQLEIEYEWNKDDNLIEAVKQIKQWLDAKTKGTHE